MLQIHLPNGRRRRRRRRLNSLDIALTVTNCSPNLDLFHQMIFAHDYKLCVKLSPSLGGSKGILNHQMIYLPPVVDQLLCVC